MVPHHVFYQLALFVLVWLFVMLHVTWSKPGLTTRPVPAQPKRKRSSEPKPFAGLTHKPPCALCEQAMGESAPAPPLRPEPMPPTNRRPRSVDTSMHFCPHTDCDYRGWLGLNNPHSIGFSGQQMASSRERISTLDFPLMHDTRPQDQP